MWVARDKRDNRLTLFQYKPRKVKSLDGDYIPFWTTDKSCVEILDSTLFPELKWEDEPIEVVLEKKNNDIKKIIKNTIFHNIRSGKYNGDVWKLYDDILEICG